MEHAHTRKIQDAVQAVRQALQKRKLDSCDTDDVQEVIAALEQELAKPKPSGTTLTMYLNSLGRSLASVPGSEEAQGEIDGALRAARLPDTWRS